MSGRAQARMLPGGRRLHLQDGPIDLVIEAFGSEDAVVEAYRRAMAAFEGLLDKLCAELPLLRAPIALTGRGSVLLPLPGEGGEAVGRDGWGPTARRAVLERSARETEQDRATPKPHPSPLRVDTLGSGSEGRLFPWQGKEDEPPSAWPADGRGAHDNPHGPVARRMTAAVAPFAHETFITPMAAVAGAVADHILAAMVRDPRIARAYVNNGGDIALHVAPGGRLAIGLIDRPDRPSLIGHVAVESGDGIGGIATSGWRGRSFSLGIADSVTVLARSAAEADAAATIIANAVDLPGHPAILRVPADSLAPDSDLGSRPVTRHVGPLSQAEIAVALGAGLVCAEALLARGLILGAALQVQGRVTTTAGRLPSPLWRGVGDEGPAERAPRHPLSLRPYAPQPSPPAPLHEGEGSGHAPSTPNLEPAHA